MRRGHNSSREELLTSDHLSTCNDHSQFIQRTSNRRTSSYQPPVLEEEFNDHPNEIQSNLYRNTPKTPSLHRTLVPQTPKRTMGGNDSAKLDLGSSSLCSYGCFCFQCVRTTEVGIVENCGKFEQLLDPGLHIMCWPISDISGRLSLVRNGFYFFFRVFHASPTHILVTTENTAIRNNL